MAQGRDAVEFILEAKGLLDKVIAEYIDERNPISPSMDIGRRWGFLRVSGCSH